MIITCAHAHTYTYTYTYTYTFTFTFSANTHRENGAAQNLGPHFARACAVETHVNISQESLYTAICR